MNTISNVTERRDFVPGDDCNLEPGETHWMSRMLCPRSIAIIGASERQDSFGSRVKELLLTHNYPGELYLVNPRYQSVDDIPCFPDITSLPLVPDLAVIVVGNAAMEAVFDSAIQKRVGGIVIFANNYLENDETPQLLERLKSKARDARIAVCGGNCMGFYNYDCHALISFDFPPKRPAGHITLIAHSGSVMTDLANTDPRLIFNLVVSPGQEISGSVADYMLFAVSQPSTRVIAIFIETVRHPKRFIKALVAARQKRIPVVVVKIGATEKSARMAVSHSGAVAGNDGAFQASAITMV